MKQVKFDGQRYWLFLDYCGKWVPFANSALEILIPILKTKYNAIEIGVVYEIDDPKDRIYGANHGPISNGVCSAAYPMSHYECAGTGILAVFSHSWGWN